MNMKWHRVDPEPENLANFLEEKRRDPAFTVSDIKDDNIYEHHPSELLGPASQAWFSCKLEKYGKSDRTRRTAVGGSWKKTGEDRLVDATGSNKPILIRRIFVFYKDSKFRKENKTNWAMHEYSEIQEDHNSNKQGQYVLCFIKRNPDKKRKPSHIERKPEKKRKTSSLFEEGQPSDNFASDSGYNVAQDISEVEPQLQLNQIISNVTKNIFQKLGSQLLPNQHMSLIVEDHVANAILSQIQLLLESQLLPNQHMYPIFGDHVANAILSQLESQSPLPNYNVSSTIEDLIANNSFSEIEAQLPPNHHLSCNIENHAAKDDFSGVLPLVPPQGNELIDCNGLSHKTFSTLQSPIYPTSASLNSCSALQSPIHLLTESLYSGSFSNNLTNGLELDHNSFSTQPVRIYPQLESSYSRGFSNYSTSGLNHNSFSALPVPIYLPPDSSYSSGFSNDSINGLNHNSFSALQFPIHPLPESSNSSGFSNDSTSGLDHNSFSALPVPIYPPPESSYPSGFSNDSINGLDHNFFSGLQFPIHQLPESSYSSGFSNDATNGLNHNSFSALQSPIHPQPGSPHSSGISNGSNVWNPQFAAEQEDDKANSHWSVRDDFSLPETGHTFPPYSNSSEAVKVGYYVGNGSDAVIETVSAWPNE